ncbi:MAG: hypothetical protein PHH83_01740, partial [Patescibacteria group bacterium]|nr:hypothetical protein [Patescibacteria group bacterium]
TLATSTISKLTVTGATILSSTLAVTGVTTLSGDLSVGGYATITASSGDINTSGNININNSSYGQIVVGNGGYGNEFGLFDVTNDKLIAGLIDLSGIYQFGGSPGVDGLFINSGNVGIGTSTPAYPLTIVDDYPPNNTIASFVIEGYGEMNIVISDEGLATGYAAPMGSYGVGNGIASIKYGAGNGDWGNILYSNADSSITLTGDLSIGGQATITASNGNIATNGTLQVTGATTLSSTLAVTGNLSVGGDATITASGEITAVSIWSQYGYFGEQYSGNFFTLGFDTLGSELGMVYGANDGLIVGVNNSQTAYKFGGYDDSAGVSVNLNTGNIGIGTSTPSTFFAVVGTSTMQNILPESNLTYALGSSNYRWSDLWTEEIHLGTSTWKINQDTIGALQFTNIDSGVTGFYMNQSGSVNVTGNTPNPTLSGYAYEKQGGANSVYVSGNYAYVTIYNDDALNIIDISDPTSPTSSGYIDVNSGARLAGANSVYVSGNYAYVTAESHDALNIIDISNPINPTFLSHIDSNSGAHLGGASSLYVSGNYAYVTAVVDDALNIIDISNPTNPTFLSYIDGPYFDGANSVYVSGNYAYVTAEASSVLSIIDISDPTNPNLVGYIDINSGAQFDKVNSVYVSGNYAYVTAYNDNALNIIDISDPTSPTLSGYIDDNSGAPLDGANSVYVSGNYAYVTAYNDDALNIIDILDPTSPTLSGYIDKNSSAPLNGANSVYVSGNYAYVTAYEDYNYSIIDISGMTVSNMKLGTAKISNLSVDSGALFNQNMQIYGSLNVGSHSLFNNSVSIVSRVNSQVEALSLASLHGGTALRVKDQYGSSVFDIDSAGNFNFDGSGNSPSADYAEYFYTNNADLVSGEAVCIDTISNNAVRRCVSVSDNNIVGIVSTKPLLVGNAQDGYKDNPNYKMIALLGQTPAFVSNENGNINPGDSLTSAGRQGYLMKANEGDSTVGIALESFSETYGTIKVLISRNNKSITVDEIERELTAKVLEAKDENMTEMQSIIDSYNIIQKFDLLNNEITDLRNLLNNSTSSSVDNIPEDATIDELDGVISLNKLTDLEAVNFVWMENETEINKLGFITTQVEEIAPELVNTDENGNKAIDYDSFTPVMISAIQEQQQQINEIRTQFGLSLDELEDLVLSGALQVEGIVDFGRDTVGQAKILTGATSTAIMFENEYINDPIITITPRALINGGYYIDEVTKTGFIIKIENPQEDDVIFDWHSFGAYKGMIFSSDGTLQLIASSTEQMIEEGTTTTESIEGTTTTESIEGTSTTESTEETTTTTESIEGTTTDDGTTESTEGTSTDDGTTENPQTIDNEVIEDLGNLFDSLEVETTENPSSENPTE